MYLFLQNFRATLIPAVAVPVVLLGTFGVLALFGYSINTLTLFRHGAGDTACWWMTPSWWWRTSSALCATKGSRPRSHRKIDGRNLRRAGGDCPGAVGGVPADGLLRRFDRGHLSPVLGNHYLGDDPLGGGGADPYPRAVRRDPEPHRSAHKGFFGAFNRFYSKTEHGYQNKVLGALRRPVACW